MTITTLFRGELDKLRTLRSSWVVAGLALLAGVGISVLILSTTRNLARAPASIAGTALAYTAIVTALLSAYSMASEYQFRTIVTAYTVEPRRVRVLVAKAAAAVAAGLVVGALTTATCLGMAAIWLHARHVPWPFTGARLTETVGGALAVCASFGLAGAGIGAVVRRLALVTVSVMGLYLGLDPILSASLRPWQHYGIGAAQQAATDPAGHHAYAWAVALAATAAFSTAIWLAGVAVARRADV